MKNLLKNFPVRIKLIVSHGTIALLAMLCAAVALLGIAGLISNLRTVREDAMFCVDAAGELMYSAADIERSILGVAVEETDEHYDMLEESINGDVETINAAFSTLSTHLQDFTDSQEIYDQLQQINQLYVESESVRQEIMDDLKNGKYSSALDLYLENYRISLSRMIIASGELKAMISDAADEYCSKVLKVNNKGVIVILILIIVCLAIGTYLTRVISVSIRLPVNQLMEVSEQMKEGNLSVAESITL